MFAKLLGFLLFVGGRLFQIELASELERKREGEKEEEKEREREGGGRAHR